MVPHRPGRVEFTCVLIKPDGVRRRVVGRILDRLESEGLRLTALRLIPPQPTLIRDLYKEHAGKEFHKPLVKFMLSGPVVASIWRGPEAIRRVRALIGMTDSRKAAPGTVRWLWGTDNRRNVIHASDSPKSARREAALLFPGV